MSTGGRGGSDIDALHVGASGEPLPHYASAPDLEMEVEPESFNEIVLEEPESRIELISEIEEAEVIIEDDEIDDDALDILPLHDPLCRGRCRRFRSSQAPARVRFTTTTPTTPSLNRSSKTHLGFPRVGAR